MNALKQALITLIENPSLAREMGELGREHIEKKFTWDIICKKLEKFYRKTIERYALGDNKHEDRKL